MQNPPAPLNPGVLGVSLWAIYYLFISMTFKPVGRVGRNEFYSIDYTFTQSANALASADKDQIPWRATDLSSLVDLIQ